ncbi:hypothetical protein [Fluviispira vulneris]|uniref:hypothetical protein n=1 Tax=Fluviispira vulneris TaxID=2763012 RepID=UPI0016464E38|nr:hypothetical protein [Fluviispira vulneris]
MGKKSLIILFSIILISCKKESTNSTNENKSQLQILNLSGNFGLVTFNKKFKLTYQLKNNHSEDISEIKATFENNKFKFDLPYPGISSASTNANVYPPCSDYLKTNQVCLLAITFQPNSENDESGALIIDYKLRETNYTFKYMLNGKGKKSNPIQDAFDKLGYNFIAEQPDPKHKGKQYSDSELIKCSLEKFHSGIFNYDDFFNDPSKNGYKVWQLHLKVPRVIGYVFRADTRAPEVSFKDCYPEWKNGYNLKNIKTGKIIHYNAQIDKYGNGINCGVKDVGGFWPTATRPKDLKFINEMEFLYKNKTGHEFDITKNTLDDFPYSPGHKPGNPKTFNSYIPPSETLMTLQLNWYLQNILNTSAHAHVGYDFKGFISTSSQLKAVMDFSKTLSSKSWIYVIYQEGGFQLPKSTDPTFNLKSEAKSKNKPQNWTTFTHIDFFEITIPGGVPWEDVIAYTSSDATNKEIYFRKGFKYMDPIAYTKIYNLLSSYKN